MADAATDQEPATSSATNTSVQTENLTRLLGIFNGGTGLNFGELIVRAVKAQTKYPGSYVEPLEQTRAAAIIRAALTGFVIRSDETLKLGQEEVKDEAVVVAKYGRVVNAYVTVTGEMGLMAFLASLAPDLPALLVIRRVTIGDNKRATLSAPHFTQRVKTFYVDSTWPDDGLKKDGTSIPVVTTKSARARSMIGGTPITRDTAIELRKITIGSAIHSLSLEWRKSVLLFHDISSSFAYGLQTLRAGSRGLVLCVQGYLLKNLMFNRRYMSSLVTQNSLQPSEFERRKALCSALCDVLWQAGSQTRCCVCLQQEAAIFDTDHRYRTDGITEKLHLYEFKNFEDLEMFVKRHLSHFEVENSNGCILLLYSLVLSRTIARVYEDMNADTADDCANTKLLTDREDCTISLLNLALTGRAVKHLHNGNIIYDGSGRLLPQPRRGVRERSQVGLLYWDRAEDPNYRTEVGSMLKTPKAPIWLTIINGQYGLLYSTNIDLVSDWRVEHHFVLCYYTGLSHHTPTKLSIETLRVDEPAETAPEINPFLIPNTKFNRRMRVKTALSRKYREEKVPALDQCILTNIRLMLQECGSRSDSRLARNAISPISPVTATFVTGETGGMERILTGMVYFHTSEHSQTCTLWITMEHSRTINQNLLLEHFTKT